MLEDLDRNRERPEPSRTEREARVLDAEMRELEEEMRALRLDPYEAPVAGDRPGLSLDEEIATIEKELGHDDGH